MEWMDGELHNRKNSVERLFLCRVLRLHTFALSKVKEHICIAHNVRLRWLWGIYLWLHLSANISIQACNYIVCAQCDDIWTVVIFHSLYLFVKGVAWQFQQNLNYGNGHNLRFNTLLKFCWLFLTIINCMGVLIQTLCNQIILMIFFVLSLNTYISVISPKNKCGLNAKWFIEKKSDWIVAPFSNHKWTDLKKICVQYLVSTGRN